MDLIYELLCLASSVFMGFTKHYGDAISIAVGLLPKLLVAHDKPLHLAGWAAFLFCPYRARELGNGWSNPPVHHSHLPN
jgi:hypothetical protein